jgi:hypothetical protein
MSGRLLVGLAAAASALLALVYLAAGGGTYEPTPVADPCAAREWRSPDGVDEAAQQFFLSALDGAACELGVSRETLAAALATEETRLEFAAEQGIEDVELEAAVRAGIVRAIDDAVAADALNPLVADGLRAVATRLPVDEAIALIDDASALFGDADGVLDDLGGLLDQAGGLLP